MSMDNEGPLEIPRAGGGMSHPDPLTKKQGDRIIELLEALERLMQAKRDRWTQQEKQNLR